MFEAQVATPIITAILVSSAHAQVEVYLDQAAYEAQLMTSTRVDFEGIAPDTFEVRSAGYNWDGLVTGSMLYQVDADVTGYSGAPYLSDFVATLSPSSVMTFTVPPGTNAIGGEWFHSQIASYDGHFTLILADLTSFDYVVDDIATGRELNQPDYVGFISPNSDITSIQYHVETGGGGAVSLADNIIFGTGVTGDVSFMNWEPDAGAWTNFGAGGIVADDVQVAPGSNGRQVLYLMVQLRTTYPNGANFQLHVYDHDEPSGLPGTLLTTAPLGFVSQAMPRTVTILLPTVSVPPDGRLWIGVEPDAPVSGGVIANQVPQTGTSADHFAVDLGLGAGFELVTLGGAYLSNFRLIVTTLPCLDCEDTEGEGPLPDDYEDTLNAGCGGSPPVFGTLECGIPFCGMAGIYQNGYSTSRDTDWFIINTEATDGLTIEVESEIELQAMRIQFAEDGVIDCASGFDIAEWMTVQPCVPGVLTTGPLPAGDYCLWFGAVNFSNEPNDAQYTVLVTGCEATGCPEDVAPPTGVEQQDLNAVLNRWGDVECLPIGAAYPCPEDLAPPDGVEQQDLNAVLNRWGDPECM